MKKIIAFAGSNSKQSINKQLASYAANQVEGVDLTILDLNDFPLPMYGIDEETENGVPQVASNLLSKLHGADGIVLSLAEHNGSYAAVFKNTTDWMSRIGPKLWNNIPMLLMATSPGARGGKTVLEQAKSTFPYSGGNIIASFSLPSFGTNFSDGIKDEVLNKELKDAIIAFGNAL